MALTTITTWWPAAESALYSDCTPPTNATAARDGDRADGHLQLGRSGQPSVAERHHCVEAYPPWRIRRRRSLRVGCVAAIGSLDLALLGKLCQPLRHAAAIEIEALR